MKVRLKPPPWGKLTSREAKTAFERGEMFFSEHDQPVNRTMIPAGVTIVIDCPDKEIEFTYNQRIIQ